MASMSASSESDDETGVLDRFVLSAKVLDVQKRRAPSKYYVGDGCWLSCVSQILRRILSRPRVMDQTTPRSM